MFACFDPLRVSTESVYSRSPEVRSERLQQLCMSEQTILNSLGQRLKFRIKVVVKKYGPLDRMTMTQETYAVKVILPRGGTQLRLIRRPSNDGFLARG